MPGADWALPYQGWSLLRENVEKGAEGRFAMCNKYAKRENEWRRVDERKWGSCQVI
jgi:hypothetical protein